MDGDTLTLVIAIGASVVLMVLFPLMTMANRTDDISLLAAETAVTEFVDNARSTGKITQANLNELVETVTATGNIYEPQMEVQVKDENLAKKKTQSQTDKTGENVYYTVFTSQIQEEMDANNGVYLLKEGDILSAYLLKTSTSIGEMLENFFYTVTGNDSNEKIANHAGVVTTDGK